MLHLMFDYRDSFFEKIRGIDAKAVITVAIIRTPKC